MSFVCGASSGVLHGRTHARSASFLSPSRWRVGGFGISKWNMDLNNVPFLSVVGYCDSWTVKDEAYNLGPMCFKGAGSWNTKLLLKTIRTLFEMDLSVS